MELQRELGNIEADMEDGGVVLTHTCKDTSPGDRWSPCSSNGSSLGQWARAKHAGERITSQRMHGEGVSARAASLRPAGRREAPAWLAFASPPSQTIWKIQGEGDAFCCILRSPRSWAGSSLRDYSAGNAFRTGKRRKKSDCVALFPTRATTGRFRRGKNLPATRVNSDKPA